MKANNDDDVMTNSVSGSGFRRTRSQAAPDWSVTESLILVNEVAAVEADCSRALSSYQQWNIIAENCATLDVQRNLAQCRRKWRALLSDYDTLRGGTALPPSFDRELFEAIDRVVKAREQRGVVDPESDNEAGNEARDATVEIGSKRKGQPSKSRHRIQKPKKFLEQRPEDSHEEGPDDDHSEEEYLKDYLESRPKLKSTAERPPEHLVMPPKSLGKVELHENHHIERPKPISAEKITISREVNEETLTLKLQDLAVEIEAIATESAADDEGGGSQNVEDSHTDFTRRQGDKLIASLGNFSNTLKQLCDLLQECK
ncbi:zinc finger and SCAN domain-containing protein 20 [Spatholobus suberectus]|nr:zinc finger and SCAN domain-containing protein 20 [Spatholobus suberectus]